MNESIGPDYEEMAETAHYWLKQCEKAEARVAALEALCAEAGQAFAGEIAQKLRAAGRGDKIGKDEP